MKKEQLNKHSKTYKIKTSTGIALVMANMIGTGVFTSLGFQLQELNSPFLVLVLWVLGGLIALSGAFSYAEIGTHIQKSGGEYAFLTNIFHPLAGYLSGWISITVGFAAPIALSAIAFMAYFPLYHLETKWASITLIAFITFIHTINLNFSATFQNISTSLKIILILSLIVLGMASKTELDQAEVWKIPYLSAFFSPAFAIALIYVSYSYSGWNAAAYITEEFERPKKSLPVALIGGTMIVTLIYTLLQYTFLKHVPMESLSGKLNVGTIAVNKILSAQYGKYFGFAISLLLLSSISAMVWVGSRVTSSMAKDHKLWRYFRVEGTEIPKNALWLQFGISVLLIITGTFEQILIYCGILLTISSMITVLGVFKLRKQKKSEILQGFKSPLFPLFQILFVILSLWMIIYALLHNPFETMIGFTNLILGVLTYFIYNKAKTFET